MNETPDRLVSPTSTCRAWPYVSDSSRCCWQLRLTVTPEAMVHVRGLLDAHLRFWGCTETSFVATLGVTELLTNVLIHTEDKTAVVLVERAADGISVTVTDADNRLPALKEPDLLSDKGRGLALLNELADDMGITPTDEGKDIWFRASST